MEALQRYDYPGNVRELAKYHCSAAAPSAPAIALNCPHLSEDLRQQNSAALPGKGEKIPTLEEQEKTISAGCCRNWMATKQPQQMRWALIAVHCGASSKYIKRMITVDWRSIFQRE
jgi:DNA-binding NtrC family response regulator